MPPPTFSGRPVWTIEWRGQWHAVVGIPLDQSPGITHLLVDDDSIAFTVETRDYAQSHIRVRDQAYVSPPPALLERIARERTEILAQFRVFSSRQPNAAFVSPVAGPYTSLFGLRRFINGQPRRPHSGLDIGAPQGTPVRAPAHALVLRTGDYHFNGQTVFLDHGHGLVTMYCHLSSIAVREGQVVERGQMLGAVGATGRVTGPHLHWSVNLNGVMVDPLLFLESSTEETSRMKR